MKTKLAILALLFITFLSACKKDNEEPKDMPKDPNTAAKVSVDRFSSDAGTLFVRDGSNGLPAANEPVDFDQAPFITQGLGPMGMVVRYYNFDVMPVAPAPIFVLFKEGASTPVDGQLNIINVIPGDAGYNDFWHVHKVTVPSDYVANTVTSYSEIISKGYMVEPTNILVNCPVVPYGSTASMRFNSSESADLTQGWYNGKAVFYFNFSEKDLTVDPANPMVPLADILVTFNINPGDTGGGPPSGFVTEMGTSQTHNVTDTTPTDTNYSPLWDVDVYDNADFDMVSDWSSAAAANVLASGVATVNCPIVYVQ